MAAYNSTVTEIEELAPNVLQLTVSINDGNFSFRSGQWVNFHFPDGVSRAYTIASAPQRPQALQLCVRVGSGRGASSLQKLEAGAAVSMDGPHGNFTVPQGDTRDVVLVAGDTGIAAIRSIVLDMLATKDPRKLTVLYEPDQRYILYAADFDPLARNGDIVHMSGAVEGLVERNHAALQSSIVMAVGFDEFLERALPALKHAGVESANIISETFGRLT